MNSASYLLHACMGNDNNIQLIKTIIEKRGINVNARSTYLPTNLPITVQGASPDQFFKARRHRSHTLAPSIVLFRAGHTRHLLRQYDTLLMPKIVIRHIFAVYILCILCRNSEGKIVFLFYYCHRCLKTLSVVACRLSQR